ncbi:MAG: hypothetical protein ACRDIC_23210 [bacterium]
MSFVPLYALDLGLPGSGLLFGMFSAIVLAVRSMRARIPDRFGAGLTAKVALLVSITGLTTIGLWREPLGLFVGTLVFAFLDLGVGLGPIALGMVAAALGYGGTFLSAALVAAMGFLLLVQYTRNS